MTNMIYTAMPALPKKHHTNAVVLPSEWNTCPLSSIVEEISETVGTRKIETISISAGIGFVNQAEKFGRELSGKQYEKYIVLHKGDFSYNKGNSNIYPQGCIYRLNNRTEAAVPNVFENFRVSVGNPDYYEQLFLSGFLNRQLYSKINRGVRDNGLLNLKGKDFYSCEVPYPPLAEQERIAEILIQCDRVIEVKEQKLDELKQLKKEFLRKMFPAKGCDTPEIRFPGFTGAWEQRKLGEIAKEVVRNDPASDAPIMMITAGNGFIEQSDRYAFNNAGESLKKYILLECGELAYNHGASKLRPYGSCFALTTVEKARIPFVYHCFSVEKSNPEFLSIELNGANVENQLRKIVSSGARMDGLLNIAYSEYTEVTVQLPKKEEQDWIAKFFKQLDTLITLHQRELEETKTYKKTLAKLLLTGIVRVQG